MAFHLRKHYLLQMKRQLCSLTFQNAQNVHSDSLLLKTLPLLKHKKVSAMADIIKVQIYYYNIRSIYDDLLVEILCIFYFIAAHSKM